MPKNFKSYDNYKKWEAYKHIHKVSSSHDKSKITINGVKVDTYERRHRLGPYKKKHSSKRMNGTIHGYSMQDEKKIRENRIKVYNKRFPAGSKRTASNLKDYRYSTSK